MQQTINIPDGFELVQTSETTFEIKKKEKQLPKTWDEFCQINSVKEGETYIDNFSNTVSMHTCFSRKSLTDRNLLPTKSDAKGILALIQLIQLCDCYNDGWKPNWTDNTHKPTIVRFLNDDIAKSSNTHESRVLTFKTSELRDKFLENFKDLIYQAKDFI